MTKSATLDLCTQAVETASQLNHVADRLFGTMEWSRDDMEFIKAKSQVETALIRHTAQTADLVYQARALANALPDNGETQMTEIDEIQKAWFAFDRRLNELMTAVIDLSEQIEPTKPRMMPPGGIIGTNARVRDAGRLLIQPMRDLMSALGVLDYDKSGGAANDPEKPK